MPDCPPTADCTYEGPSCGKKRETSRIPIHPSMLLKNPENMTALRANRALPATRLCAFVRVCACVCVCAHLSVSVCV